ncbi:MAG TPA: hypothetical protein VKB31_01740 [Trueperaceae bacterium]|nr:hypothetical protein [Trueperaceae bacterium]
MKPLADRKATTDLHAPSDDGRRGPWKGLGARWLRLGRRRGARTATAPEGSGAGGGPDAALDAELNPAYDRLVALYTSASTLHDCALVETRVGEDALSYGDQLRASQHFAYSRHYRDRATEAEARIDSELDRLRRERHDWERVSASALTRARQRLYGAGTLARRPQFE